jgi:hypothetical protein
MNIPTVAADRCTFWVKPRSEQNCAQHNEHRLHGQSIFGYSDRSINEEKVGENATGQNGAPWQSARQHNKPDNLDHMRKGSIEASPTSNSTW